MHTGCRYAGACLVLWACCLSGLCVVPVPCAQPMPGVDQNGWVPTRCVHYSAAGPQEIHLPRLDSTGTLPGSRGREQTGSTGSTGRTNTEISNVRSRSRGRVSVSAGAASLFVSCFKPPKYPATHTHTQPDNTTRTIHPGASISLDAAAAEAPPNPLSEHGLTNISSNKYHRHDLEPCHTTTSLLFIINNLSSSPESRD